MTAGGARSPRSPRYAAGRARALGLPTRGTTAPNRLRRVDRWLTGTHAHVLRAAADPLVVDLGFGSSPVTTVELAARLRRVRADVRVVGLELDPERVAVASTAAEPPLLEFARGGFELAGLRPVVVRALNVLRQYEEPAAWTAWATLCGRLDDGGLLVEGTCDETGRRGAWVALGTEGPRSLTLAAHLPSLDRPGELAERLPKVLIGRNVPGEPVERFLRALDRCWDSSAAYRPFGPRAQWVAAVERLAADWPVAGDRRRWRLGEVTVAWEAVRPGGA